MRPLIALPLMRKPFTRTTLGEFGCIVAFLLPSADSRVLTRELLYTRCTRARDRLILVGAEGAIRTAIDRPISRASGLRKALWGEAAG